MKPVKKLKFGTLSLSAWEHQGKDEQIYHTFTFQRSYKDKDDKWQNTNNLRLEDLPKLKALLYEMYKSIGLKEDNKK